MEDDDILGDSITTTPRVSRRPTNKKSRRTIKTPSEKGIEQHMMIDSDALVPKRLWYCTDHHTTFPFSPASIVLANDADEARCILDSTLAESGLKGNSHHRYTLEEVDTKTSGAWILTLGKVPSFRI